MSATPSGGHNAVLPSKLIERATTRASPAARASGTTGITAIGTD